MKLPVNYEELQPREKRIIREEYIVEQNGKCYHCGKPLLLLPAKTILEQKVNKKLFPDGFFKWPVHLHHDHDTGLTIGAVHAYCNAVLWQYHGE